MDAVPLLGDALALGADDVAADLHRRTRESACVLDDGVEEVFLSAGKTSTTAFALWLSSGDPAAARRVGLDASRMFALLAARNDVPLNEATKRCLRWHDAVADQLSHDAARLDVEGALPEVLSMLQRSLHVTVVRMTEAFEVERQRLFEELVAHQEQIAYQANHDALTGLPNRALIVDRIEQLLSRHARLGTEATVLFVDLDNFKAINDNFGHTVGDHLLQAVAKRVSPVLRGSDTLGRLGGDEFIVVADLSSPDDAPDLICRRVLEALREPFVLEALGSAVSVTASIGVATAAEGPAEELMKNADIAMYRAKRDGKNRHAVFKPEMLVAVTSWFELDTDLRRAVELEEFVLVYQPIFDLASMSVTGVEALLRWGHGTRGIIAPGEFISHLEESDLIFPVGRWVIEEAVSQAARWKPQGRALTMSVNISARQLDSDEIVTDLGNTLDRHGLDPRAFCIEVTETALMHDLDLSLRRLRAISALGVRIAIDDFGTGYSSFSHLQEFPVDLLKIDQSFIQRLSHERSAENMVHAQIQMAKAMGIETLAEGVERPEQLAFLKNEQCDSAQGFLLCRPLDYAALDGFIENAVVIS
jgi:diguanylate cyclase (GGDEF)-like protein